MADPYGIAWLTGLFTLGGVTVTSFIALVTTGLSRRWDRKRDAESRRGEFASVVRAERRIAYAEALQAIMVVSYQLSVNNIKNQKRVAAGETLEVKDLDLAAIDYDPLRDVEIKMHMASLISGTRTAAKLKEVQASIAPALFEAELGTDTGDIKQLDALYEELVAIMREELSAAPK